MMQERKPAVVLIAEDDKEMRSLLCDELYDLGVSIREAADGDEALHLEILRRKPVRWPSASRRISISRFASASSKEPYGVSYARHWMEKSTETLMVLTLQPVRVVRWPDLKKNLPQSTRLLIPSSQLDWKPSSS
jgi:hypothetical protein